MNQLFSLYGVPLNKIFGENTTPLFSTIPFIGTDVRKCSPDQLLLPPRMSRKISRRTYVHEPADFALREYLESNTWRTKKSMREENAEGKANNSIQALGQGK